MTPDTATRVSRIGLVLLAVTAIPIGAWAVIAPRSYYDDFPGFGSQWISPDGPYNEHLMRDFGALNLALAAFTVCAAIWLLRPMVIAASVAWIVYPLSHLTYHVLNLDRYDTVDQIGILAGLAIAPIVACGLLVLCRSLPSRGLTMEQG
ncbi:MAG: hypothetical protein WEA75_09765 [Acidimicrobiia bacterium]